MLRRIPMLHVSSAASSSRRRPPRGGGDVMNPNQPTNPCPYLESSIPECIVLAFVLAPYLPACTSRSLPVHPAPCRSYVGTLVDPQVECVICCTKVEGEVSTAMDCGHRCGVEYGRTLGDLEFMSKCP